VVFLFFFCVHDAAATRGQYLALSKADLVSIVLTLLVAQQRGHLAVKTYFCNPSSKVLLNMHPA